jgi:anti-anti-sigma regulatory factor
MNAHLKVLEGKPQGVSIPLSGPQFVIGRDPTCHLRPKHESVDPKHCRLRVHEGSVSVRDLGSECGTLLNGRKISPADSVIAMNGDLLKVGNLVFEVSIPTPARPQHSLIGDDDPGEDSPAGIANRLLQQNVGRGVESIKNVGSHLHAQIVEGIPVITVDFPRLVDDGIVAFRRELRNLAERPALSRVVLDFQRVRRMSTEAAEVLLAFEDRLRARGASVKLCEVGPEPMRVLEAMGVPERITISFDVHDAVWSTW